MSRQYSSCHPMNTIEHKINKLKKLLEQEHKSQLERWDDEKGSRKELRQAGELLHPLQVLKHGFDVNSTPVINVHYPNDYNPRLFSSGTQIVLFNENNDQCAGTIRSVEDRSFEIQLYDEEVPTWILEDTIGMKPKVDEKSFKYMMGLLNKVETDKSLVINKHLKHIYEGETSLQSSKEINLKWNNHLLNDSQKCAVQTAISQSGVVTIQGPPGTGKTTTLVELIQQLNTKGEKVIASAPSNTAVDHLAIKLIAAGVKIIRLVNTAKVETVLWSTTPEGILSIPEHHKQLKKLRKEAEEYQKKAQQYKRNFTQEDRENRKLWRKEARKIKAEIRSISNYILSKEIEQADVVLGTPVGLCDSLIKDLSFDTAVNDEAGQCLIPMGFLVMDNAEKVVLCGDQQQLPPTVIDREAEREGLGISILEEALKGKEADALLSLQYRMPPQIAGFSSEYFYDGKINSSKKNTEEHLFYYDTAGAGYQEKTGADGSKWNEDEMDIIEKLLAQLPKEKVTIISPYAAQVRKLKAMVHESVKCSTIDGFQGQENDIVILSLVRNNEEGKIGFLKDYRRMNVAMTRAKEKLFVIGDSTTLGGDPFYQSFIEYCEALHCYHSVFEILYA